MSRQSSSLRRAIAGLLIGLSTGLSVCASLLATAALAETAPSKKQPRQGISRDIAGMWTGGTLTPFERPPELSGKTHHAESELAELQRASTKRFWDAGHRAGDVGRDNDAFLDDDLRIFADGQTAWIVDPPDGRLPLSPLAEQRRDRNLNTFESYETMSQWDRCITRQPTSLFTVNYNNAYQIVQTKTHVVISAEMIHDARVIPLGGAHNDPRIRSWSGDSRARWEGNTLVVDTTNFNDVGWISTGSNTGRLRGVPYSTELHTIERFTRTDANTLQYEMTIEDPKYFQKPWTVAFPLHKDDGYRMFEYACHEDNSAVEAILRGARAQESASATQ